MLVKYISILYLIISPEHNHSLSIRKDIEFAKQLLNYYGMRDADPCSKERSTMCPHDDPVHVCCARLVRRKMQFKEFYNFCHMDLDNLCKYQDSIWTVKHSGSCNMNENLRRFAKEIEETADISDPNETTAADNDEATTPDEATEDATAIEDATDANDSYLVDETTAPGETETEDTTISELETAMYDEVTEDATDDEVVEDTTVANNENLPAGKMVNDGFSLGKDEIGKIFFADGSVKAALREGTPSTANTRFPPMRGVTVWDRTKCEKRVKPCPNSYYPICLYNHKEEPNNITYYYFINLCEAQQWSCYHPERGIYGSSSVRAGFCAHIQYINYARFMHTMSAWGHYGWLHGPGPFSHILKPHERA